MEIKKIIIKGNQEISFGKFTILVGPNNVGKSQTLRDINRKFSEGRNSKTILIEQIEIQKPNTFEDLFLGLDVFESKENTELHQVRGIMPNLMHGDTININQKSLRNQFDNSTNLDFILGNISKYRISYLDAQSRLNVAQTVNSFNPNTQPPQNLLQGLFGSSNDSEKKLRDAFIQTFGLDIRLDYSGMTTLSLRIAKDFAEIPDDPRKAFPIFNEYSKLDDQGDGFRSFVGVVLSLLLSEGRIILLDEPEAFLHPAQARQLGLWIAEYSRTSQSQIIIATHNANFLSGILSSSESVDIFRLNRNENDTKFTHISSEATSNLSKSPLLSSQRVLEAIFHKGVVVCEADADRAFYQSVCTKEFKNQEALFIHAHNKQTIPQVVKLLKSADIPVCAIADIDILNSKVDLFNILNSLNNSYDFSNIISLRDKIAQDVENKSEENILDELLNQIKEFLAQLEQKKHNLSGAKGALNRLRKLGSAWSEVKSRGVSYFGTSLNDTVEQLFEATKKTNLFIVPVGELEGWLDVGTKQKNKWIVLALQNVSDGGCSNEVKKFIKAVLVNLNIDVS